MTKRLLDIVGSSFLLIVTLPLWCVIAIAVCLEGGGSPLYSGVRVGYKGRPFRMLKFRTMHRNAEGLLTDEQRRKLATDFKLDPDPRVTSVGRLLRRLSLDELPQLWNVVRGDMSLVGPRPKLPEEIDLYGSNKRDLLSVRPGITGYWQIHRTSANSDDVMRSMDLRYVRSRSLWLDTRILLSTLFVVLKSRNY